MRVWFVSIYHCWLGSYAAYMGRVVLVCLFACEQHYGKNVWMDFYEISKMGPAWNKEHSGIFLGLTRPRLARLFHIPQIRCGGGLRSRGASCYWDCHSCMLAYHSYLSGSFCSSVADIWNMQKTTSKWIDQLHKSHYGLVPPQCTISHNAPICNRNVHMVLYKIVHCGIFA